MLIKDNFSKNIWQQKTLTPPNMKKIAFQVIRIQDNRKGDTSNTQKYEETTTIRNTLFEMQYSNSDIWEIPKF